MKAKGKFAQKILKLKTFQFDQPKSDWFVSRSEVLKIVSKIRQDSPNFGNDESHEWYLEWFENRDVK